MGRSIRQGGTDPFRRAVQNITNEWRAMGYFGREIPISHIRECGGKGVFRPIRGALILKGLAFMDQFDVRCLSYVKVGKGIHPRLSGAYNHLHQRSGWSRFNGVIYLVAARRRRYNALKSGPSRLRKGVF